MRPVEEHRDRLWFLLRLAVTVVVVLWVWGRLPSGAVLSFLWTAPWWAFVVPTVLMLVNALLHAIRTQVLLSAVGVRVRLWPLYGALLRAVFVGLALPTGGGELAKIAMVGSLTSRTDAALAAIAVARILELLPWSGLLLYGLLYGLLDLDPLLGLAAVGFFMVFMGLIVVSVAGVHWGPAVARLLPGRLGGFASRTAASLQAVRRRPDLVLVALGLTVPFALCNGLAIWVALQGHGIALRYLDVLAVFPAADTLISLPITISGVGIREGVFIRALSPWGATEAQAVAAGLTRWVGELGRAGVGGIWMVLYRGGASEGVE